MLGRKHSEFKQNVTSYFELIHLSLPLIQLWKNRQAQNGQKQGRIWKENEITERAYF